MAEASATFETIAGCKVHIQRGGDGAPLLFLHGGGGAPAWTPFFEKLSGRFDVIAPEHPGFGRSDTPDWLDRVSDLANFYLDLIAHLGLKDVHLVGHSLGGWIAAELATRNTSSLASLTLLAPAGIHVKGVPKPDIFLWTAEERVRGSFANQALADAILKIELTDEQRLHQAKNMLTMAKVAWSPRFYDPHLRKWLHRIDKPTLLIWGDSDAILPPAYGPAYRDLIPGAKLVTIAKCGHAPQTEQPDETIAAITGFIDKAAS